MALDLGLRAPIASAAVGARPRPVRSRVAALAAVAIFAVASAQPASAWAPPPSPPCPDAVIASVGIVPNAVGCWNAIAVQAVRLATPYQVQSFVYLGYTQVAVYDAVTKIAGRYVPYEDFVLPPGVTPNGASLDAATAAAAYAVLTSPFVGLPAAAQAGLPGKYGAYVAALRASGATGVDDGLAIGAAAAAGLIADRAGDRDESITYTPGPLTPGAWTFAPPPSLQSAQTPWLAQMRPFMLDSASQFRPPPPPALSSARWAVDFNEVKLLGATDSPFRSPKQTAIARFWNANAVNQSNQAFQDVVLAHDMDLVDAARLVAMGNLVDSDAGIACWDAKYHYLFWRPVMAIRNAGMDRNRFTQSDPGWTPLLTTPNHPEYPAAHTCVTGAEADMYATVLGTRRISVTVHGSADGTPNNWASSQTFARAVDLKRQIANARVWAGLHYRTSTMAGLHLAHRVVRWSLHRFFLPVDSTDGPEDAGGD